MEDIRTDIKVYTLEEVARILQISKRTLYSLKIRELCRVSEEILQRREQKTKGALIFHG